MSYAYVGCRTTKERNARGKGLKTYKINESTGEWTELQCLKTEENPSYQTMDNEKKYLYTVHGDTTKISSFKIMDDGTLEYVNTVDIGGKNPVYITVDRTNQFLIVATLQGGTLYSIKKNADGSIGNIYDKVFYEGKTKDANSFIHQCTWDRKKEFIFAPAQGRIQGYGQIRVFRFNSEDGKFETTCKIMSREYAEPRHIVIHPNNRFAYMVNEKDNTMIYFEFDSEKGVLEPRQILSTLPDTYTGDGQASAAVIDASGQILIGSNRCHDSLAIYRINSNTGYMTQLGFVPALGKTPRFITFNKKNNKLYVANEDSDKIVEASLDTSSGIIEYTGNVIETESPVCIVFN